MAAATSKDYYQILGISEGADAPEIKKSYRKLAKQYHPDANQNDPRAAERFKEVGEAYAVLSNPAKRKQYDQMRRMGPFAGFRGGAGGGGGGFGGTEGIRFSTEDLGDLGGLGDLFSSIFDFGRKRRPRSGPERGTDLEYTVEVHFETAARGGTLAVAVPVTDECATCGGSGAAPGARLVTCVECGGSGTVSFGQGGFAVNRPCPACYGRGQIPAAPCPTCAGTGQVRQERQIRLKIPPGVDTGTKMRLSGQGQRGQAGGSAGDLLITFQVQPHRFFRRKGLDIHVTVPVNIAQAALGSRIRVRTVDGRKVSLKVPPGTQSGTRFRIPGQGIEKGGARGDQYVQVKITVPEHLDEDEARLMKQFAEAAELKY
ncbi:MAG TPA: molecular chaperone DnaJ [Longimicrobiales bacterium]|nr:molecular chaperone DnaJ [Longimicrobiales bacterium]